MVFDVVGWFSPRDGALFTGTSPGRILDTRDGTGGFTGGIGPGQAPNGQSLDVPVLGRHGVPAAGVSAVVLNVTSTQASLPSCLTIAVRADVHGSCPRTRRLT